MQRVADLVGRALGGRYHLMLALGSGASAAVYLAEDRVLGRNVAVKVLHPGLAADESFLRRFQSEARTAAALHHPHIVQVYDWGQDEDAVYVVLEHLAGGSLRQVLDRSGPLTVAQAAEVGRQAARGLAHAHARGLVHRDIKPANLLFDEEGRLAIADFGLARAMADATWTEPEGVILGTARYASPEQAVGHGTSAATDVYSLALVLAEATSGTVPFSADTTVATLMARQGKRLVPPQQAGPLGPVLVIAAAPEATDRPGAAELADSLDGVLERVGPPARIDLPGTVPPDTTEIGAPPVLYDQGEAPTRIGAAWDEAQTGVIQWSPASTVAPPVAAPQAAPAPGDAAARARRQRILRTVNLLIVGAVIGLGVWLALGVFKLATPSRAVPDERGKTVAVAQAALTAQKFQVRVGQARFDENIASGQVAAEDPPSGVSIKQGSIVELYPSKGPAPRGVPDLSGTSQADASSRLQQAGFAVKVVQQNSETAPVGQVMSWSPQGVQAKGTTVTLTVSSGPAPRTIPQLAGDTYDQAAAALSQLGLSATQNQVYDNTYPAGQVTSTSPAAGASAAKGSTVSVNVSKGPQYVNVPNVSGMTIDHATQVLQQVGLLVGNIYGPSNSRVFVTDPPAGSHVATGTSVDLYTGR